MTEQQQEEASTPDATRPLHVLPAPFSHENLTPITQGAEALVYKTTFLTPNTPVVVKYRPPKPYRHAILDKRLTKQRLLAEARSLVRVKKEGINVPGVLGADWDAGWLVLEYISGRTVRRVLDSWAEHVEERRKRMVEHIEIRDEDMLELMRRVGREVGRLHALGVCHGDLTTSNLMLRGEEKEEDGESTTAPTAPLRRGRQTVSAMREAASMGQDPPEPGTATTAPVRQSLQGDIFLIDFGLTTASIQDEDKAVDLYVLERAFSATHPAAEPLFQEVLKAYGESYKGGKGVLKRLEGVRLRGRKRSMLG